MFADEYISSPLVAPVFLDVDRPTRRRATTFGHVKIPSVESALDRAECPHVLASASASQREVARRLVVNN